MDKEFLDESVIDKNDKVAIIICTTSVSKEGKSIYDGVRLSWKLSDKELVRIEKADYILAVVSNEIQDVFVAHEWKVAIRENFPDWKKDELARYGFIGYNASKEIRQKYMFKKLSKEERSYGWEINFNYE